MTTIAPKQPLADLQPLIDFDESKSLSSLTASEFKQLPLTDGLTRQLEYWELAALREYVHDQTSFFGIELSSRAEQVKRKFAAVKKKVEDRDDTDVKLTEAMQRFQRTLCALSLPRSFPYRPQGIGALFIPALAQNARHTANEESRRRLAERFAPLTPCSGEGWQKKIIEAFLALSNEEIEIASKEFTLDQVQILIDKALSDQTMAKQLPLLMVSLKHYTISMVLKNRPDADIRKMNQILKQSPIVKEEWFKDRFTAFKKSFIDDFNDERQKIDSLNDRLRDLQMDAIGQVHVDEINSFREHLERRRARVKKFDMLIDAILPDFEFTFLSKKGLPMAYTTLINRLSTDEDVIEKDAGAPFGILYRKAFESHFPEEENYEFELASKLLKKWGATDSEIATASKRGFSTVFDLKNKLIFNRTMLTEAIKTSKV